MCKDVFKESHYIWFNNTLFLVKLCYSFLNQLVEESQGNRIPIYYETYIFS